MHDLSIERDEIIVIGADIEVSLVMGDRVRLGINAPRHVSVHRREVYDAIKRGNGDAAKPGVDPGQVK